MDGRTIWRVLLGFVLALVVVGIGVGVYNAGLAQGVTQAAVVAGAQPAPPAVQPGVNPAVVPYPYYGVGFHPWGFHPFGFLWLLFPLLFFFLIFALFRAAGGPRRWGRHANGWTGSNGGVPQRFEDWHRRLHEGQEPPTQGTATTS